MRHSQAFNEEKHFFTLHERRDFKKYVEGISSDSSRSSDSVSTEEGDIEESSTFQSQHRKRQQRCTKLNNDHLQLMQRMNSTKHTETAFDSTNRSPNSSQPDMDSENERSRCGSASRSGKQVNYPDTTFSSEDNKLSFPSFNDPSVPESKMKTQDPCLKRKRLDPWMDFMRQKDREDREMAASKAARRTSLETNPTETKSNRFPTLVSSSALNTASKATPNKNDFSLEGQQCFCFHQMSISSGAITDQGKLVNSEESVANRYNRTQIKDGDPSFHDRSEYHEQVASNGQTDPVHCKGQGYSRSWPVFFPPVPPLNEANYLPIPNVRGKLASIKFNDDAGEYQVEHQQCQTQCYSQSLQKHIPGRERPTHPPITASRLILLRELTKRMNESEKCRKAQSYSIQQTRPSRDVLSLSTPEDENWLSEFLCFVRSDCVEVFTASQDDVASRMNSKKVKLDQVGIRCRYCAHISHRDRAGRSSSYPSSLSRIYQSLSMMLRDHFPQCQMMPHDVKDRFLTLKANTTQGATNSKRYWVDSARSLGLMDTEGGIQFVASDVNIKGVGHSSRPENC